MPSYFDRDHRPWFPLLPSSNKRANQQLKLEEITFRWDSIDSSFFDWGASLLMVLVVVVPVLIFVKPNFTPTSSTPAKCPEERTSDNLRTLNEESKLLANMQRQPDYT